MAETPRIWIGSLAAYNGGDLIGDWFDADDAPTDSRAWVEAMIERGLAWVSVNGVNAETRERTLTTLAHAHEEIWVFEHENFGAWLTGECNPSTAQEIVALIENLGDDAEAAGIYLRDVAGIAVSDFSEDDFRDHYRGEYESARAYADDYVEQFYLAQLRSTLEHSIYDEREKRGALEMVEWLGYQVDSDDVARELSTGGTTFADAANGNVFVFGV